MDATSFICGAVLGFLAAAIVFGAVAFRALADLRNSLDRDAEWHHRMRGKLREARWLRRR